MACATGLDGAMSSLNSTKGTENSRLIYPFAPSDERDFTSRAVPALGDGKHGICHRDLKTEQMNGYDQMAAVDGGGFSFFTAAGAANSSRIPLMRSLAFRLASGPSKRGRGH
ncbi:hypothetical protein F2Q68_00038918 [Brassica cretica]|uniref:Protein kinase domain-containing protein n=2 Tax=Brassica cretica TaxID=69181 RepID=A0ABQ7AE40_BRACR|nr:hypothetical protein F2Q68_00038918 [Brassica cretica]KAF3495925.1 hypothetical protein DY000_02052485 [Brassica cretica]